MSDDWPTGISDEELLRELARALATSRDVPTRVLAAGKAAWSWRSVDAELAQLISDSDLVSEPELADALRSERAVLRSLSFVAADLIIELEVTEDRVLGQLVPAQPATLTVQTCELDGLGRPVDGAVPVAVDEVGWFRLDGIPARRFRLSCALTDGRTVLTGWISL